jgi:hypothetical protein
MAVPEDHYVTEKFHALYEGGQVVVTAVLQRTAVIVLDDVLTLVRKDLLLVDESFTLARVDPQRAAMRGRAARGWRTNWRRKTG